MRNRLLCRRKPEKKVKNYKIGDFSGSHYEVAGHYHTREQALKASEKLKAKGRNNLCLFRWSDAENWYVVDILYL